MADPAPASIQERDPERSTQEPPSGSTPTEEGRHRPFWRELPVLVVIAFAIALLLKSFVLQAFYIPSASMEETLQIGDRVLVEKVSYRFTEPGRGDVVVFAKDFQGAVPEEEDRSAVDKVTDAFRSLFGFPTGTEQDFIKRVVAIGGDTVEGKDGRLFVNGDEVQEPYLANGVETSTFGPLDVPAGMMFVMGDNRGNSDDSRSFGPVPIDTVVGRAFILIWPPADLGTL